MELLETIVSLGSLVILGSVIARYFKKIPVSLIQIGLGLLVAVLFNFKIDLESEWFMLLFVAPLLYVDAWTFPKRELWELRGPIFGNAILLVFLTTLVGGYLIYWMIPEFPLPVAFATAAILSPTDPVAVSSIGKETALPKRLMNLVAGESLINDASGLVAFKVAISAAVIGTFSFVNATEDFLFTSIGGAGLGFVVGTLVSLLLTKLVKHHLTTSTMNVVMQLLTPFMIYILAETLGVSGVIAVVISAITQNVQLSHTHLLNSETDVLSGNTWNVFSYVMNGIIFVILGIELPVAINIHAADDSRVPVELLFGYALFTWLIIFFIRVLWTYGNQRVHQKKNPGAEVSWRIAWMSGFMGVRGAVTMAGVLSVPMLTKSGSPFPARSMMLFIAAMVIILSLVAAIVMLPRLARRHQAAGISTDVAPKVVAQHMSIPRTQIYVLQAGMTAVEQELDEANAGLAYETMMRYQLTIRQLQLETYRENKLRKLFQAEVKFHKIGLDAQREVLEDLYTAKRINHFVYASEVSAVDKVEENLNELVQTDARRRFKGQWRLGMRRIWRRFRIWLSNDDSAELRGQYHLAHAQMSLAALTAVMNEVEIHGDQLSTTELTVARQMLLLYRSKLSQRDVSFGLSQRRMPEAIAEKVGLVGIQAQREAVTRLYDAHFIDEVTARHVRQRINYDELKLLGKDEE